MTNHQPKSFIETALGRFILAATAAGIIFGGMAWLDSVRQNAQDAVRQSTEAKTMVEELKHQLENKADKKDIDDIKNDIRDFRRSFEQSLRVPDIITRYKYKKMQ